MKSWKTTLAGLVSAAALIGPTVAPQYTPFFVKLAAVATSLGLIAARDNDKRSEDVNAGK